MAHSTNIISKVKLPGSTIEYEIHDANAIHSLEDLNLATVLTFAGTDTSANILAKTSAKKGEVWLATDNNIEYVCKETFSGAAASTKWEKLGNVHDAASSSHTHSVTVTGTNGTSAVSGTITIPTVSKSTKYMAATVTRNDVSTDTALGTGATFKTTVTPSTTNIKATASGAAVGANGTASAITGFGEHTTDVALGADATFAVSGGTATTSKMVTTTVKNPSVSNVSIPNVTGNTEVTIPNVTSVGSRTAGTAASWSASVSNGVLSFSWTANTPTAVTMPTLGTAIKATNTTLGTALSASKVTTSNVTVATGALASDGGGSSVATGVSAITVAVDNADPVSAITGLGEATKSTVLTGVKMTAQPTITLATGATAGTGVISVATGISSASTSVNSADTVTAVTAVPVPTVTLSGESSSATGRVAYDTVTIGSGNATHSLTAAAQKWTQKSGTTGTPQ
jgi:hypothetical protein